MYNVFFNFSQLVVLATSRILKALSWKFLLGIRNSTQVLVNTFYDWSEIEIWDIEMMGDTIGRRRGRIFIEEAQV